MVNYKDPRWQKRRLEIMERDGFQCVSCSDKESELHVHHKRYKGQPWEAEDDDMQTLCVSCHKQLGPHPKGGVWYERIENMWEDTCELVIAWCPLCGNNIWKDKGSYDKCISGDCGGWSPPCPDVCDGAMSYRCEGMQKGGR